MKDMETLRISEDDRELDRRLMDQPRPERPETLREARRQVELLVALGLSQTLSGPESAVAATQVTSWFEGFVRRAPGTWGGGAYSENGGQTVVLETSSGNGGISVSKGSIPDLIEVLKDAASD
ncbi:MAG: hypothetical protein IJI97_06695 [Clostridia bacterium]|jgi:hypothetical protein|nr:hypothetical protein [Clostridia bacterium]